MRADRLLETFRKGATCVRVVTYEEPEMREVVLDVASQMDLYVWAWSSTMGLRHGPLGVEVVATENPAAALSYLQRTMDEPAMVVLLDMAPHLSDPIVLRALRDLIERFRLEPAIATNGGRPRATSRVILIDHNEQVPLVIEHLSTRYHVSMPDDDEIEGIIKKVVRNLNRDTPIRAELARKDLDAIVENLRGLTRRQVSQLVHEAVVHDHALTADDLALIVRGKKVLMGSGGVLEFVEAPTSLDDIGGMKRLKAWLKQRERAFDESAAEMGLPTPRGVLLLGVQGAGKSLASKAIATAWKRPLMRLDPGALFDRYVGESERRLREALRQAEAMSPCVLWIDEIEKGFASASHRSNDGGLSQRMFGTLLTWMQEHKTPVFLVATANDIEAMPPELLRKGRFDEIFFVDLPEPEARGAIFKVHLKKRKLEPARFDLPRLVEASEGFSGAEIEQAVISGLHAAVDGGRPLVTADVLESLQTSPPLSVTMAERIAQLRAWAKGRCVPAS